MKDRTTKKGLLRTGVLLIMLLFWYGTVFSFSAQDGEESGSLSRDVSYMLVRGFDHLTGTVRSTEQLNETVEAMQWGIRKTAHFTEYFILGVLLFMLLKPGRNKVMWPVLVAVILLSASADEFHQTFVPGRCGSPKDVLLDFAGGITGCLICFGIGKLKN